MARDQKALRGRKERRRRRREDGPYGWSGGVKKSKHSPYGITEKGEVGGRDESRRR